MGDKTDLNVRIDHLQDQIQESQVKNKSWLKTNAKLIAGIVGAMGVTNGAQLGAVTFPSLNQAKISGAEATAATDALRMTSSAWMEEIALARADERADCQEQKDTLNEHWRWRMENHVH